MPKKIIVVHFSFNSGQSNKNLKCFPKAKYFSANFCIFEVKIPFISVQFLEWKHS